MIKNIFFSFTAIMFYCVVSAVSVEAKLEAGKTAVAADNKIQTEQPAADSEKKTEVKKRQKKDYSPYPQPGPGYVTDIAGLLTREQNKKIQKWLWQVEKKSKIEIIVVTIDSIKDYKGTANSSIEAFAAGLFNKYGIGNMPKNDGILLLVARKDRKARIELGKFYKHSRDGDAARIMQKDIIPYFKDNKYGEGIVSGVEGIMSEFAGMRVRFPWEIVIIAGLIIVLIFVAVSLFRNGKKGWGWVVLGIIFILALVLFKIVAGILRNMPNTDSGGWSSGGLGGFGGGSSGGGGATGSW